MGSDMILTIAIAIFCFAQYCERPYSSESGVWGALGAFSMVALLWMCEV